MELSQHYTPAATEERWYKHWISKGYFNSTPDEREPFTVVIPPPNVTGVLHMGHTLNETVQDILVRRARMSGKNACWVPGSDHASIATETKVVHMLKEQGIEKNSLTRQEFLKYAFEWKEKYGGIIYHQIEKLGCSVDWNRVTFTMDDHYYAAVIKVFMDLYAKGLIYRGARMINWDPAAKTALSDEEVEHRDGTGKLFYVKYALENATSEDEYIMIATQRPETIMGDTGVCVNPSDARYTKFKGRKAIVPIVNRAVPIVFDDYVDPAFGTGALKVTPAHDINDYNLGLKYELEIIDTLNEDGTMSAAAEVFVGEDRFVARKKVVTLLQEQGLLVKEEEYATRLGYSQRSGAMVEPRISTQWFVKMKELATPALEAVVSGNIKIHPGDRFLATYKYWLENVKDWCISRQLWWGQQIPAWYDVEGKMVIAATHEEALGKYAKQFGNAVTSLKQDEDCLDTWFSSWLWPMEVFKGISNPGNADAKYYYPTQVLVTGQDIIFFWVARMVMAGMHYENERPFADVYFTGMVRDEQGRKMSKQLGNSPDLLELIDAYGADAVRFGIMISSPAGNDLLFDKKSLEQGKNFNNKMWNALKLLKMWEGRQADTANADAFAIEWFGNRLNEVKAQVNELMNDFKLSEALKVIYSLVWDDFCSWYLEWVKPGFEQPIAASVYAQTISFYEQLMQLLHPYMPFVTEEIFHLLQTQTIDLCVKQYEPIAAADKKILNEAELLKKVITALREARAKNQIKPKETIKLHIQSVDESSYAGILSILAKQVNAEGEIQFTNETVAQSIVVAVEKEKFYIVADLQIDMAAQKEKLLADLQHQQGFLNSVMKKLGNEKFVQNAKPDVLAIEQKKKADAEARIKVIEESLASL
jgi:valyl-tRNA synthetase